MNTRKPARILTSSIAALAVVSVLSPAQSDAASGSWNVDAAGNWSTTTNWTPAAVPGTAAGDVVNLQFNISAARTVTIDGTSRTVGDLNIGDPTATLFGYTLASSAGTVVLNLDGTGATDATVDFTAGVANTISAPLTLVDNAVIRSNVAFVQTLSGVISGAKSLTFNNDTNGTVNAAASTLGQFLVTGANTYSLGTTISDVRVQITTNNTALGTGAVTIQNGGQMYMSTALTNVANTFNINGQGWTEAAGQLGALRLDSGAIVTGNVVMQSDSGIGSNSGTGTINGVVSGAFALTKRGVGTLALGGNNTFSGGLTIGNGSVQLNNNNAAGTGGIELVTGGGTNPTRLLVNGGVTASNPVTITGSIFNVAGSNGLLQQTGTGQARLNGAITINGTPTAGGFFVGGAAVGNELVLGGAINSSIATLSQRDGRVIYAGGGSGGSWNALTVTGTAIIGATNGIPTGVKPILGGSASAALDLNGFNQTLAGVDVGNAGNSFTGSIALGGNTLTLNGDYTALVSTGTAAHLVTATTGGTIDFGASARNMTINDNLAVDDVRISGATITSTGGVTKTGTGTLALSGATLTGPFVVSSGTVRTGSHNQVGSFSANNITFANGATLAMKAGSSGDLITAPNFVNSGTTNLVVNQLGGLLPNGTYNLINYAGGTSPGLSGFALAPVGHATASLIDTGSAIALSVTGNDQVIWDGTNTSAWATGATGNWKLGSTLATTDYIESDDVIFQDGPISSTVNITANVSPSNVTFTNTTSTSLSIAGTAGIIGTSALTKSGDGVITLGGAHQYSGATTLSAGTTNLTGTLDGSSVTVAAGSTLSQSTTGSIRGTGVTFSTSGTSTLTGANTYTGATTVGAGTLTLNYNTGTAVTVLNATSAVNVAGGATLRVVANDAAFNFNNSISGSGTVELNSHFTAGSTATSVQFGGNNSGFTGTLRLLAPVGGSYRILQSGGAAGVTPANLGSATIEIQSGTQILTAANATYNNNITNLSGIGYSDGATNGNLGALRLENGSVWAGNIVIDPAGARITAHGATTPGGTISGNISGGPLEANVTSGSPNVTGATLILTGSNSYTTTTIGGSTGGTVSSRRLNIGAGGTTGTLGSGAVTLNTDGHNAVLGFDRSDSYTLGAGNTITAAGSTLTRSFVDFDTTGTGFSDNGVTINLGGPAAANAIAGGVLRVAQARAGAIANFSGTSTAGTLLVGGGVVGAANGVLNLNNGANMSVAHARVSSVSAGNTINFNNGSTFTVAGTTLGYFSLGEVAGGNATVNQNAGSTVNVESQLRVGHFGTNTSTYNMNGGSLTMTGASPTLTPSTAAAGGANATGDNNINAGAAATAYVGGGIYLGVDGQGIMNHSGGTVTTNWIVLDNRGASGAGANMADGLDRYSISGSALLKLRSNWGLIGRNDGSYAVSLGGGTVQVDNTGSGTGTGANITIPLDAIMDTVASTTTTLDTNGTGNGFTLSKDIRGIGTLALTGGGAINLSTTGNQAISASFSGANPINKIAAGTTTLNGANSGYTGPVTVSAGRLDVNGVMGAGSTITVADGATLGGETSVGTLTFGTTTGATLKFNPGTIGAITATNLVNNAATLLDFSTPVSGDGTYTAINYTNLSGAGTFAVAGASNYRSISVVTNPTAIDVVLSGTKALTWNGTSPTWDVKTTANWIDNGNAPATDMFYSADVVVFDDTATSNTAVTVTPGVSPALVQVAGTINNYTLTSTGAGIASGALEKDGTSTLTLVGPNTYPGKTTILGGTVSIADPVSLGNSGVGNSIALSNAGKLVLSGSTAVDLGANRSISVGPGGGGINVSGAIAGNTTVNYTIPGNISGNEGIAFTASGANATANSTAVARYVLTGNNAGFTGPITVGASSSVMAQLTITNQAALPASPSITLNYPAGAVTSGNATTLDLGPDVNLPVGMSINLTANLNGTISQRSQIVGAGSNIINGPITISGNAGSVINIAPSTAGATMTINGNITEGTTPFGAAGGPATYGAMLFRNSGNTTINGQINMPNGMFVRVDNTGITTVNSTGNIWAFTDIRSSSTLKIGATNALAIAAPLRIGQVDAGNSLFDMNGFSQEIAGLDYITGNGANTRGIVNNGATASTLTINNSANFVFGNTGANAAGNISGNISIVKNGTGTQTLQGAVNTYTGNVTVNAGTLVAGGSATSTVLGSPTTAGRTVTVNNSGTTLSFTTNNVFGNGVGNNNLPAVTLNAGTTLTSTRYNVLGPISLNGATLTQSATDSGSYEGFQFRGDVNVAGTAQSVISTGNGKANHLNANTTFTVADATTGTDLLVSAPLRNQSGDFATAVGGLTKDGAGTMELSAANVYTGATTVTAGTLVISGSLTGSAVTVNGGTLGGNGTITGSVTVNTGATLAPGMSPGILSTGALSLSTGSTFAAEINGTTVGTDFDQVNVTGGVTLGGGLSLSGTYSTTVAGDLFTLILNDGSTDLVSGTFAGLAEGASVVASGSGQEFTISYVGGDGNDVVLTAVPEPGSAVMLLGGVGMLLGLQRRRRKA